MNKMFGLRLSEVAIYTPEVDVEAVDHGLADSNLASGNIVIPQANQN